MESEFQLLDFSTAEFEKNFLTGIFGIGNRIGIPLPMGSQKSEPKIGIPNQEGNKASFNYVQAPFRISSTTSSRSSNIRSKEKCHIIIHAPSGWKLSDQNASSFCTLSANGSQLILKFEPPPAVFNKEILRDMIADFGEDKPYRNMATGTLHHAVMAIMRAADVGQSNFPDVIMKIKLLVKCQSVCAIEGLYDGRGATAKLEKAPIPAVRRSSSNPVVLVSPSSMINDVFVPCQLLHYSQQQSESFPVSLLHIELSGSTSGATNMMQVRSLAVFCLCCQPGGGRSQ